MGTACHYTHDAMYFLYDEKRSAFEYRENFQLERSANLVRCAIRAVMLRWDIREPVR